MAFFDKLGKKFENMVQDAQEYTSDFIEVNRLSGGIRTERDTVEKLQRQVGAAMHKRYQAGEAVPAEIRADLEEITARLEKIAGLETKIEETKRQSRTERAEVVTEADVVGQPVDVTEAVTEADIVNEQAESAMPMHAAASQTGTEPDRGAPAAAGRRFCTNCGEPLIPGKPFCGNCGQRND